MTPQEQTKQVAFNLNEMLKIDPDAMNKLFQTRIPCNEALGDSPLTYVTIDNHITPVGLVNSVLKALNLPSITLIEHNGNLQMFINK